MDFYVRRGASKKDIEAMSARASGAFLDAFDAGEEADVKLLFEEDRDPNDEEAEARRLAGLNYVLVESEDEDDEDEDDTACEDCGEAPCLFLAHQESLVAFDKAMVSGLAPEDVPPNNSRRKSLYRELTLRINGGPLGAGVRRALPDCCVSAIRQIMPSPTASYMGFKADKHPRVAFPTSVFNAVL